MFDFQQKRKLRAVLESRVTWSILLVLAGFMIVSAYGRYQIAKDMEGRRLTVEAERAELLNRKTELEKDVKYLEDERGIEAEMRRQFDVAKSGEQVVIIVEDEVVESTITELSTTTESDKPWYRFW
jgi:cell division protein FtsB